MKCADCRFWRLDEDSASSAMASEGAGECRRRAPKPLSETATLLLHVLKDSGNLDTVRDEPKDYEAIACWSHRFAIWPTTWGSAFCGEFVPRQDRQAFV